jgi:hypothetical protein
MLSGTFFEDEVRDVSPAEGKDGKPVKKLLLPSVVVAAGVANAETEQHLFDINGIVNRCVDDDNNIMKKIFKVNIVCISLCVQVQTLQYSSFFVVYRYVACSSGMPLALSFVNQRKEINNNALKLPCSIPLSLLLYYYNIFF